MTLAPAISSSSRTESTVIGGCSDISLSTMRTDVYRQPVDAELPDSRAELFEFDRLRDVAVRSQAIALDPVPIFIGSGENYDRQQPGPFMGSYSLQHLKTAYLRQVDIQEDQLGKRHRGRVAFAEEQIQRFSPVAGYENIIQEMIFFQGANGQGYIIRVVFHQQDCLFFHDSASPKVK